MSEAIPAVVCKTMDEFERAGKGAVFFPSSTDNASPRPEEGGVNEIWNNCAGCGRRCFLRIGGEISPKWKLESLDPLTLSPSVHHNEALGGCGWHGYLREGKWVEC